MGRLVEKTNKGPKPRANPQVLSHMFFQHVSPVGIFFGHYPDLGLFGSQVLSHQRTQVLSHQRVE